VLNKARHVAGLGFLPPSRWLASRKGDSGSPETPAQTGRQADGRATFEHADIEMSRGGESAGKRRVTAQRNDRKALKSERRQQRRNIERPIASEEVQNMARFHQLNERRAAGAVSEDEYERQRHEIFVALGLEQP
jgi:hypothetical protein